MFLKKLKRFLFALCLFLAGLLCCSCSASAASSVSGNSQGQYIQIPQEQWSQLKQQTNLLEAKLQIVSDILATQKTTSSELVMQLAEAKLQLQETQKALTSSRNSLENARASLKRSNELYETLMEAAENDRKAKIKAERQRNLAEVIAGCLALIIITK